MASKTQQTQPKRKAPQPAPATTTTQEAKAQTATPAKAKAKRAPKEKVLRPCLCGCGRQVPRKFAQGHDARYKGILQRAHANCEHPDDPTLEQLAAVYTEATGQTLRDRSALGLANAASDKLGRFVLEFHRPGTKVHAPKVAVAG